MIVWLILGPFLMLPFLGIAGLCALPTMTFNGRLLGGGLLRQWLVNHVVLPLLPQEWATQLVSWFTQASVVQEWVLCLVFAINVNAVLLPVLYGVGLFLMRVSALFRKADLDRQRSAIRS